MEKVIVFGANGQLGSDIIEQLQGNYELVKATHTEVDLSDVVELQQFLLRINPRVIINTAAYHHVELCEQHPEIAYRVNAEAPAIMAAIAGEINARFIHFSTDYVFDGKQNTPYEETAEPNPLNIYGKSKLEGEQAILRALPEAAIMRVSGLYGKHPCRAKNGLNFVQLMLKLARERGEVKVVDDEFVSPTFTENIALQTEKLIQSDLGGIIHSTSEGACSWYEFAAEIFSYTATTVKLDKASSNDFPSKVARPKYSVLENARLKQFNANVMMHWKEALHAYLDDLN